MFKSDSNLNTDALLNTVGSSASDTQGTYIGDVVEVTRNAADDRIEYMIIKSNTFFGPGSRYFAVPVSSLFIGISPCGEVILKSDIDDFQFAKGVAADRCPKPDLKSGKLIYELYMYNEPNIAEA